MSQPPVPQPSGRHPATPGPPPRRMYLLAKVVARFAGVLVLASAVLFLPAGTIRFWQAWSYLAVVFLFTFAVFVFLVANDSEIVERRLETREAVPEGPRFIRWSFPFFLAVFLLPGFDHRFEWSRALLGSLPFWLPLLAQGLALAGLVMIALAIDANRFAARTIHVEAGQQVISHGPYCLVRHPLYAGCVLWILATPLALGSYATLPAFMLLIPFYVCRLLSEERVLRAQLPGYTEYCLRTRYRLVPYVW
jgi:protein-S-isoprenylcysteine O-methyltransferase Ste14